MRRGLTLTELLVVTATITILAALLVPATAAARSTGRVVSCVSQEHQIYMSLMRYCNDQRKLPFFCNVGNADSNCLKNWADGGNYNGLGLLLSECYARSKDLFFCGGRKDHGAGGPNDVYGIWYCDYAIGWHSGDDIWWGGICGLRMRNRTTGEIYTPAGGGWNIECSGNPPYWPPTFSPTMDQYRVEWVRGPTWGSSDPPMAYGSRVLFVDNKSWPGWMLGPADRPHLSGQNGTCNVACVDGHVESIAKAFGPTWDFAFATPPYKDCNSRPHHERGYPWWWWVESKVRR